MMESEVKLFAKYCKENFSNEIEVFCANEHYNSLPICILDCIYSLRAKYFKVTVPVVKRYANRFMQGDMYSSNDTLADFIARIEGYGECSTFAREVLENNQVLSGRNKTEVCLEIAKKLYELLDINNLADFQQFKKEELLELVLHSIKGVGDAGVNYLFMLAGDPNRCKPDVHIHHCIKDALGYTISNEECQLLFRGTVDILNETYPTLKVRDLDSVIWRIYQSGQNLN